MRWLIIGTSWISKNFVKALKKQNQKVVLVYSRSLERGKLFAKNNKIDNFTDNFLKNLDEFDCAYIASPNSVHYKQAKILLKNHKDVMVEKIMTNSYRKTKKLFKLSKKYNQKILEAYVHITNPQVHKFRGKYLETKIMQKSSKIKNNTWKNASTFSRKSFGGALPDLGCYPLSFAIFLFGKVTSFQIKNVQFMNKVEVEADIITYHENGKAKFKISKINDDSRDVYLDGKKILKSINYDELEDRMSHEISVFINNDNLDKYKNVSLGVARVIKKMKHFIYKKMLH